MDNLIQKKLHIIRLETKNSNIEIVREGDSDSIWIKCMHLYPFADKNTYHYGHIYCIQSGVFSDQDLNIVLRKSATDVEKPIIEEAIRVAVIELVEMTAIGIDDSIARLTKAIEKRKQRFELISEKASDLQNDFETLIVEHDEAISELEDALIDIDNASYIVSDDIVKSVLQEMEEIKKELVNVKEKTQT